MNDIDSNEISELETVIAIPPIPFKGNRVAWSAHERNIGYLTARNYLSGGRKRAIALGGTSLIHHLGSEEYLQIAELTGRVVGEEAIFIAGLLATPASEASTMLEKLLSLQRPPDYILLMPLSGVLNPEGVRRDLGRFIERASHDLGARFLVYLRRRTLLYTFVQMLNELEGLVGIKIGTVEEDLKEALGRVPPSKKVLWGVGDRATEAARLGSRGHTSGITLICPRACDEINNAYTRRDFEESSRMERVVEEFEAIRFMDERAYNYSAVVAAAKLAGFGDVDLGEGGPFNAEPPPDIIARLEKVLPALVEYH